MNTFREVQALLSFFAGAGALVFTFLYLRKKKPGFRTFVTWIKLFQALLAFYLGILYLISWLGLTVTVFGSGGAGMDWYRPGIFLLIASICVGAIFRYRSE